MTSKTPTPEELSGLIQGLTSAVKATHDNQKTTQQNIQEIAHTVKDLATTKPSHNNSLRLPPVNLPTYKGDPTEKLERFLEHFTGIITTSAISPRHYVSYLKQQCQQDIRAFDIIAAAKKEFTAKLLKDQKRHLQKNIRLILTP